MAIGSGKAKRVADGLFLLVLAGLLLAPAVEMLVGSRAIQTDNRALATAPSAPTNVSELAEWPKKAEAFVNDHFGFRRQLIDADGNLRWTLFHRLHKPDVVYGRNGRLFLSEGDTPFRVLLSNCGAWWDESRLSGFATEMETSLTDLRTIAPDTDLLVIPTASALYPDSLPSWIARACAGKTLLVNEIENRLRPRTRSNIYYPLEIGRNMPEAIPLIPKENFHWRGQAVSIFMNKFVEEFWHMSQNHFPTYAGHEIAPDISLYLPGVDLKFEVQDIVWSHPGEAYCGDQTCADRFPLSDLRLPNETSRLSRPGAGPKLLILSDSFGNAAMQALFAFFDDVIMLNMNNFQLLSEAERKALWSRVTSTWRPDRTIMLVQDGNLLAIPNYVKALQGLAKN